MSRSAAAQRVVDAAMATFAERGYAATTIGDLERAAGLTPGAGGLYRHFRSKEEILEAGVRDVLDQLDRLQARPHDDGLELREALTRYVRGGLAMIRLQRRLIRLLYRDLPSFPALYAEVRARLVHVGTHEFAARLRTMSKGLPTADRLDHEALATIFAGAVTNVGVVEALLDTPPPVDDDRFVRAWVAVLHAHLTEATR